MGCFDCQALGKRETALEVREGELYRAIKERVDALSRRESAVADIELQCKREQAKWREQQAAKGQTLSLSERNLQDREDALQTQCSELAAKITQLEQQQQVIGLLF